MTLRTQKTKVFSIFHARKKKVIDHHQIRDHFSDTVNMRSMFSTLGTMGNLWYTGGKNVWCDRPFYSFYLVKWPQEKWACDFHDDAMPLSFQLQVAEDFF